MTHLDRVGAEALLQALTGGATPEPGETLVYNFGDDSDGFPWGFGVPESSGIYISVKAKPNSAIGDGVIDDTTAIQDTINLVSDLGGGVVFLPEGTYLHSGLTLKSNVILMGTGWKSILKLIDSTDGIGVVLEGINTERTGLVNLAIDGNKANQSAGAHHGISLTNTAGSWSQVGPRHYIRNVLVHDCKGDGIVLTDADWSDVEVYSSDNDSDGMTLVSDFCKIILFAEGNGAFGFNIGTAVNNFVTIFASGNSSGGLTGTKDKNAIWLVRSSLHIAGLLASIVGTDGSSNDVHFKWGKDGSGAAGNPEYFIRTTNDAEAKTEIRGDDGSDDRAFIQFDHEEDAVRIGESGGKVAAYGTTPIVLQTGVAVTVAGIHAALVNLGWITA